VVLVRCRKEVRSRGVSPALWAGRGVGSRKEGGSAFDQANVAGSRSLGRVFWLKVHALAFSE
jgi:hypothetical protein